jgi:hypothetical protein
VIEAAAYRRLLATAEGRDVLRALIHAGVLVAPTCFEPDDAITKARCAAAREDAPILWWPKIGTATPDLVLSRQLGPRGECYHFLADARDLLSSFDPVLDVPSALAREAYVRCVDELGSMLDETLVDPRRARAGDRGAYVLMHAVEDSYSPAHVARAAGGTGAIVFLHDWTVQGWIELAWPRGLRADPKLTHLTFDERDWGYLDRDRLIGGIPCIAVKNAWVVPEACLTPPARAAVGAIVDLLILICAIVRDAPVDHAPSLADPRVDAAWRTYVLAHFDNPNARIAIERRPAPRVPEYDPDLFLGVRGRPPLGDGRLAGALVLSTHQVVSNLLPFVPGETLELGTLTRASAPGLEVRASLDLDVPIFDRTIVAMSPIGFVLDCANARPSRCETDMRITPFRLRLVFARRVWVEATTPSYSWIARAWRIDPSLSVGWAWDLSAFVARHRLRPRIGDVPWDPPPITMDKLRRSRVTRDLFAQASLLSTANDQTLGVGLAVRWDHDRWDRRSWFAPGLDVAAAHGTAGGRDVSLVTAAGSVRWYVNRAFAITVAPLSASIGQGAGSTHWDVGGLVGVSLIVGSLELSVDSPRLSYRGDPWPARAQLTVRLGWLF